MNYPKICNKESFLSEIAHKEEIGVIDKGDYTIVQYNVAFPDTFDSEYARECRGIIFDNRTGEVIRRPFHKFFNVNEKAHTQMADLQNEKILYVTDKLDGTMIAPFIVDNRIIWGTKRVSEEFNTAVWEWLDNQAIEVREAYTSLVRFTADLGVTPIFEFHNPEVEGTCIVLKYEESFLRLLAMRDNEHGDYFQVEDLYFPDVQFVQQVPVTSLPEIKEELQDAKNTEGRVIMLEDSGLVKMKAPWYVSRHRIKEVFSKDHIKAQLVLDCHSELSIDDIMPELSVEDKLALGSYWKYMKANLLKIANYVVMISTHYDSRKEYGLAIKANTIFDNLVYSVIDSKDKEDTAYRSVVKLTKKYTTKAHKFQLWRDEVDDIV